MCFISEIIKAKIRREFDGVSWTFQISTNLETNQSQEYWLKSPVFKKLILMKIFNIFIKMIKFIWNPGHCK